jgi:YVTN family beta-propeller protein
MVASSRVRWRVLALCAATCALVACGPVKPVYSGEAFNTDPPALGDLRGLWLATNSGDDTLSFIDPQTRTVKARMPVGLIPAELEGPHHVALDPRGESFYVNLSRSVAAAGTGPHGAHGGGVTPGQVLKLSTRDGALQGVAEVDPNPGDSTISADGKTLYVTHYDLVKWTQGVSAQDLRKGDSRVAILDTATMSVRARVPLCPAAHGVRLSSDGKTLYATCGPDELAVMSTETLAVTRVLLPGATEGSGCTHCPYGLGVAPDGTVWLATLGSDSPAPTGGAVFVYDPGLGAFDTARTFSLCGRGMFPDFEPGASPADYTVYLPEQGRCGEHLHFLSAGGPGVAPSALADLPLTGCVNAHQALRAAPSQGAVVCEGDHTGPGSVTFIDPTARSVSASIEVGVFPDSLAVIPKP